MTRNGKIACLPHSIREELSRRIADGQFGTHLLAWLNNHPEVRPILVEHFGGRPINKPNLTHWRQGGFREWFARRELLEQTKSSARHTAKLAKACGGMTDHIATLLASRYAAALSAWDGDPKSPSGCHLRTLAALRHDIVALRRGEYNATRIQLERDRFDYDCAKDMHALELHRIHLERENARNERIIEQHAAEAALSRPAPLPSD